MKKIFIILICLFFVSCFDDTDNNVFGQYRIISERPVFIKYNTTEGYFEEEFETDTYIKFNVRSNNTVNRRFNYSIEVTSVDGNPQNMQIIVMFLEDNKMDYKCNEKIYSDYFITSDFYELP